MSKREDILDNIQESLERITVANGHPFNIGLVTRLFFYQSEYREDTTIVISQGLDDASQIRSDLYERSLDVRLLITFNQLSPDDIIVDFNDQTSPTIPTDQIYNQIITSVFREVMSDRTRGGLAVNTVFVSDQTMEAALDRPSYVALFNVIYRHSITALE